MAVEDYIARGPTPPAIQSLPEIAGQAAQAQAAQQTTQLNALKIQQEQRAIASQNAIQKAFTDAKGDLDQTLALASKYGALPSDIVGLQQHVLTTKKSIADLSKDEQDLRAKHIDLATGHLNTLLSIPQNQAATQWQPLIAGLIKEHDIKPEDLTNAGLDPNAYPGPDKLKQFILGANGLKIAIANDQAAKKTQSEAESAQGAFMRGKAALTTAEQAQLDKQKGDLATALSQTTDPAAREAMLDQAPRGVAKLFEPIQQNPQAKPEDFLRAGMSPADIVKETREAAANTTREAETKRHNLSEESISKINADVAQGRLAQERMVNGMKYGPGTQEYWVEQLKDNPDSVKEMPAELRSAVGAAFRQATGLPLPTAATANSQQSETAARNALDGAAFINKALENPEVRKQLGPIMGRLGNAEQAIGTAVGLSPEAAQLAQELRTRMRYFVFQEGKAVLGGRLPQQLMSELESSSASPKMNPDMLKGALNGAVNNAQSVMDNVDKQRFGGKMRPREMRAAGGAAPDATTGGTIPTPASQAEYNALPKGAKFKKPNDPTTYTKN